MKYLFTLLCLLGMLEGFGQSYSFSQYEVEDGLIQSSVTCFLQDQYSNLWIGTSAGLSRFDGEAFVNYGVQDGVIGNHVFQLFQYGDSLLVATDQGLSVFDGALFHNFQVRDSVGKVLSVRKIFADREGTLRLILEAGIFASFDGQQINLTADQRLLSFVSGIAHDHRGVPWLATYEGRLYTFEGGALHPQLVEADSSLYFSDLYIDAEERFWITSLQGILQYDSQSRELVSYPLDMPPAGRVFKIAGDGDGMLWVGTSNGVFSFDPATHAVDPRSLSFSGSVIRSIYLDREKNLWFGSFGDGFYKFKGRLFTKLRQEEGLQGKTFMSILKDRKEQYWFGSYGGGLSRLKGREITNFDEENGLSNNFVSSLAEDETGLWIGTLNGLNYFDGSAFRHYYRKDGLPSNTVYSAYHQAGKPPLFGTEQGLVYFENDSFIPVRDQQDSLFTKPILMMREWKENALLLLNSKSVYVLKDNKASLFLSAERFDHQFLTAITLGQDGRIWISTINGKLFVFNPASDELTTLNNQFSIPSSMIYSLIFASDSSLLLGTQRGINRLYFNQEGGLVRVQHYGKDEGFLGVEANANAIMRDDDGSIWIGTVNGIYRLHPDQVVDSYEEVQPHLTGIKLFYESINWLRYTDSVSRWYQIPQNLQLSHKNNHLIFTFKAISMAKPGQVLYSFMLEGYEEAWTPATDRNEAVYPNLPPGDYTFKVRARSPQGIWSEEPVSYGFSIAPPYWQTWWFYLLMLLLTLLLIRLYIYWNLRRERSQRVQLELEVMGRTREIQSLNNSLEKRVRERTAELELSNKKFEVEFELRKLDQEKLAIRERDYRQLVNNLREVIFKTDVHGRLTFLNDRWQEYMGYNAYESLGKHFTHFLQVSAVEKHYHSEVFQHIISKELPYYEAEIRMKRKGGATYWAKVSARTEFDEEGEIIGTNGSLVDIDQRKKAEFALRASEDRYKFLTENTQDIITLQSPDLYYFYASPRIFEVAGHEPEDMLTKSSLDYLHPDDVEAYVQLKEEIIRDKKSKGMVVRFRNGSGEYNWYETFLKPILDENGGLQSFISSSRDVTDKVELSKEIEKVRKKVAQDFHDEMGNNLASISVLSQIIQNKLGRQEQEVDALLNKIDVAAKNLFSGTRDFIWAIDPKNDNLMEVYYNLKDFGEELFDNTGINFYARFEQEEGVQLKLPSGWSRQLVLIFKEAFTNALKYSRSSSVNMDFFIGHELFTIEVSDNGVGLPPHESVKSQRGIRNMKERSAKIKAVLEIISSPMGGTRIILEKRIHQVGPTRMKARL
jgi:PAS domain S-box-containing protein